MHVILWRFRARPGLEARFEAAYGPDGDWARFFRSDPRYLGSDLMRASDGRYLTLDRWESAGAHEEFRRAHATAYDDLDARCAELTVEERALGGVDV